MRKSAIKAGLGLAAAACLAFGPVSPATAEPHSTHDNQNTVSLVRLHELNDSGASGIGLVKLHGNKADVRIVAHGLLADHPHAQHFHISGAGQCPTADDDANNDGIVSTLEGVADYGVIGTSLTTSGDTSPASGLAVDRFPTAPNGVVNYERTITLSDDAAGQLRQGNAVIVLHGVDANGSGTYDGDTPSPLNPALPLEATAPAACGDQLFALNR